MTNKKPKTITQTEKERRERIVLALIDNQRSNSALIEEAKLILNFVEGTDQ